MEAGAKPALNGSRTSAPYLRANPSAIWLRQEFPMQRKRTRFTALSLADGTVWVVSFNLLNEMPVNAVVGA